jgi:hypothetical protein
LPGFWLDLGAVHNDVARKFCLEMVREFKDIGVGVLPCAEPREADSLQVLAYEGVDILADTILVGICQWLGQIDRVHWVLQLWYPSFCELVELLRGCVTLQPSQQST